MAKRIDLAGHRFGKLTAISPNGRKWLCKCDCGKETEAYTSNLRRGHTTSCGCNKYADLTGCKFGRLTVLGRSYKRYWLCLCDCGNRHIVRGDALLAGNVQSCGCIVLERDMPESIRRQFVGGTQIAKIQSNPTKSNKSGIVGVNWDKSRQKWQASIKYQGIKYNLGRFDDIEDAAKVRKEAEKKYFEPLLKQNKKDSD